MKKINIYLTIKIMLIGLAITMASSWYNIQWLRFFLLWWGLIATLVVYFYLYCRNCETKEEKPTHKK